MAQRTNGLSGAAKRALNLVAVAGEPVAGDWVRRIYARAHDEAELSETSWLDILDELCDTSLVVVDGEHAIRLQHDAFREAVYARLNTDRRQQLHMLIGRDLEKASPDDAARLAYHFGRSTDDETAVRYLFAAADQARHLYANTTTLTLVEQALSFIRRLESSPDADLPRWLPTHCKIELRRADAAFKLGLMDVCENVMQELQRLASQVDDPAIRGDALTHVALILSELDRHAEVIDVIDRVLPELDAAGLERQRCNAWRMRGYAMWELGRPAEMLTCMEQALQAAQAAGRARLKVPPLAYLALAQSYLAQWDSAVKNLRAADEFAMQIQDPYLQAVVPDAGVDIWEGLGMWSEAIGALERSQSLYDQSEVENTKPSSELRRGALALLQGMDDVAEQHLRQALVLSEAHGKRGIRAVTLAWSGQLAVRRSDVSSARTLFDESISVLESLGSQMNLTLACSLYGIALLDHEDVKTAEGILARAAHAPFSRCTPLYRFVCARAAAARGAAGAKAQLHQAQSMLRDQAACIADPDMRKCFLAHPFNQLVLSQIPLAR